MPNNTVFTDLLYDFSGGKTCTCTKRNINTTPIVSKRHIKLFNSLAINLRTINDIKIFAKEIKKTSPLQV